mmetsp:Transcript_32965/g.24275  ORF Transcript_32965/g.24275 Transcript_32965/m.24275 type:complete len:91 (+) Transcript_32965:668-940(+)
MQRIVSTKPDVAAWTCEDVTKWLVECHFDPGIVSLFRRHQVDGFALLMLKDHDLEVHLKIDSLGFRKDIIKHINILKSVWYKKVLTNEGA